MSNINLNAEYTFLPENTEIIDNNLYFINNKVNSFYYGTCDIEWNIFLTFHYHLKSFQINDDLDKGYERRWKFYKELMLEVGKNVEGLTNSSIVYLGVGEYKNDQMHTHILINLKNEHLHLINDVKDMIHYRINHKIVYIPNQELYTLDFPPNIQEVRNSSDALSYILKPDWMSMSTYKEVFFTDMNEEKPNKNRFLKRCEFFSKIKRQNQLKSNTSEVNILDENFKDNWNGRTSASLLHREVQCENRAVEKRIVMLVVKEKKQIDVKDIPRDDGYIFKSS
jgi:hypothetical protein